MLRFRELQLYNWGYAPFQVPLPIGNITLLQGRNGSGKSTYLSAITILLGARHLPKRQAIDRFIYPGEEWAFVRAVADNRPNDKGQRPFDAIISHELGDHDCVTLACMLERKGRWERRYFIVPGDDFQPHPDDKIDKIYCYTPNEYRQSLTHVGIKETLLNLLELGLYGLGETSHDPIARFNFFLKLVGDADTQERYRQARQAWREQQDQTNKLDELFRQEEEELKKLEEQVKVWRKRQDLMNDVQQYERLAQHAELREIQQQLNAHQTERIKLGQTLESLKQQIAANEVEQSQFQIEFQAWQAKYQAWKDNRDTAEEQKNIAQIDLTRTENNYQQQQAKVIALQSLPNILLEEAQLTQQKLEAVWSDYHQLVQSLVQTENQLKQQQTQLESGQITLPSYVTKFLQALRQANIRPLLLADEIEVIEPRWQAAVEGVLGGERYTVIIEAEADQIKAKQIGQEQKYRHWVSPPNSKVISPSVKDSLWDVVRVLSPQVQGWVSERLADIQRVETITEGHNLARRGITSVTNQAYLQQPRGGRSVWPQDLVCGRGAREAQLREVNLKLQELTGQIDDATRKETEAKTELDHARQLLKQVEARLALPAELEKLETIRQEVEVKKQQFLELEDSYKQLKTQEDTWNQQTGEFSGQDSKLRQLADQLKKQLIETQNILNTAQNQINRLTPKLNELQVALPELDERTRQRFESETLSQAQYQAKQRQAQLDLDALPSFEFEINEDLYRSQRELVSQLGQHLAEMRKRERDHRQLFEKALADFQTHLNDLFSKGMNREFRKLCRLAGGRGEIELIGDEDHWGLEVKIGFDAKPMQSLETAYLSQGQGVMTGLFLILAALQAVRATPILLLDELMSTLDEFNAPLVLEQLRITGAQCFVATPHIRPQADSIADAIWALQPRQEEQTYAPPVGVLVRRATG